MPKLKGTRGGRVVNEYGNWSIDESKKKLETLKAKQLSYAGETIIRVKNNLAAKISRLSKIIQAKEKDIQHERQINDLNSLLAEQNCIIEWLEEQNLILRQEKSKLEKFHATSPSCIEIFENPTHYKSIQITQSSLENNLMEQNNLTEQNSLTTAACQTSLVSNHYYL